MYHQREQTHIDMVCSVQIGSKPVLNLDKCLTGNLDFVIFLNFIKV
jgi:hypothetical protein